LWHFRVAETQAAPLVAPPPDPAPEPAAGPCRLPVGGGGDPLLAGLNPAQQAVVTHLGAPLIVQAGPGTGKTRALTHRLAYLMQHRGVQPEEILAVTFTRQAAGEMADRLKLLLPDYPGLERLAIKTFHALGQQLLTAAGELRQVAKEEARLSLVREIAKRRHLALVLLEKHFITWKQQLLYPGLLPPTADPQWAAAYEEYETALAEKGWWDYEDLIARPLLLLQQNPGLLRDWQRFRHILVDEYQDLNEAQYRLFRALAGPEAAIMVIGDPNQAIYGFRGASPAYFHRFREDWPQAVSVRFSQTYRLPAPVLQAAQEVLAQGGQEPEALQPQTVAGKPVVLLEAASARSEAKAIARQIEQLVGGLSHRSLDNLNLRYQGGEEGVSFREVAVLYRFHALGAEIEAALAEAGIPCQQAREGVGPEWEGVDLTADRVKLLTLHAAKGLEFPYVFIAGCEAGLIPWESEKEERRDPAEESRLFYVGLTRAKTQVFLSRARVRSLWGKTARTRLSPLAAAISPEKLLVDAPAATAGRQSGQSLLFPELQAAKTRRGNKP
jgi:DNA helicase-2/ATP-dependent DNA helicase PcrA